MKKTIVLLVLVTGYVSAVDWSWLDAGNAQQQQSSQQQSAGWSNLFGQSQQQPQADEQKQGPGFLASISNMMKVMQDPEVKAKMEELKQLIDKKMSGSSTASAQQSSFDWNSLFGRASQKQAPQQQQSQEEGSFGQALLKLLENAQQQQPAGQSN